MVEIGNTKSKEAGDMEVVDMEAGHVMSRHDINQITSVMSKEDIDIVENQRDLEKETEATSAFARFLKKLEVPHEGKPLSVLRLSLIHI